MGGLRDFRPSIIPIARPLRSSGEELRPAAPGTEYRTANSAAFARAPRTRLECAAFIRVDNPGLRGAAVNFRPLHWYARMDSGPGLGDRQRVRHARALRYNERRAAVSPSARAPFRR